MVWRPAPDVCNSLVPGIENEGCGPHVVRRLSRQRKRCLYEFEACRRASPVSSNPGQHDRGHRPDRRAKAKAADWSLREPDGAGAERDKAFHRIGCSI